MTLTRVQEVLLDRAAKDGRPLSPERAADAGVLLRAEALVLAGLSGSKALVQAREESRVRGMVESGVERREALTQVRAGAFYAVWCPTCEQEKPAMRRPDLPGLAWPTCGHRAIHDERAMSIEDFLGTGEGS